MLSSQITVTPRFRRAAWIRWEVPMAAASPSPTTIRYFLSGWAILRPVATASARPWVAPKLSPPQVAKVWRPTQPMPVPKMTSSCLNPSSSMAWRSQFSIMPMPQPWQAFVGIWLGLRYFAASLFMTSLLFNSEGGLVPPRPTPPPKNGAANAGVRLANFRPDVGQFWNRAAPRYPFEGGSNLRDGVELAALAHEVDLPLVRGGPHDLPHQLAVVVQLADQVSRVPPEQLVGKRPERDQPEEAGLHPPPPGLQDPGLHRPGGRPVGHGDHLRVLQPYRLVAEDLLPVVADLVDQPVGLGPLGFHRLDVVALLGVGVGRDANPGPLADDIRRHVHRIRVERVKRHRQVVAPRHHDAAQLRIVPRQKE